MKSSPRSHHHYCPPCLRPEVDAKQREALARLDEAARKVVDSRHPREKDRWRKQRALWLSERYAQERWGISLKRLGELRGSREQADFYSLRNPEVEELLDTLRKCIGE